MTSHSDTSNGTANGNNSAEGQAQSLALTASQAGSSVVPRTSNTSNQTVNDNNPAERGTQPSAVSATSTTSTARGNDSNGASGESSSLEQLAAQAAATRENNGEESLTEEELLNARRQEIDRINGLGTNEDKGVFEQYCVQTQEELRDAQRAISILVHPDKQPEGEWEKKATDAQKIVNRVYNKLVPTLPLRMQYEASQAANQASVEDDDHNMVDAANQPPVAVDAANQPPVAVDAANQPPVAVDAVPMSGLEGGINNLCLTDDGEPIFAKRQVFKNFHFLIREHSGSYVWRSCEEADPNNFGLVEKPTKEFTKNRKRQYKGILWLAMAVDKAIVYPICTYPQISIMAEWRDDAPPTLMWRGELNKIAGKEKVDKDMRSSLPFVENGVHLGRKYVVMSETQFGLDQGKRKAEDKINDEDRRGTMAQASVQQAAVKTVAAQPVAAQPVAAQPVAPRPAAPLSALAQPAAPLPALAQPAAPLPALAQLRAPLQPAPLQPAPSQPAAQPTLELLQSSDFQQMLAMIVAQAVAQTQSAPIQPLAVQQQQQQQQQQQPA